MKSIGIIALSLLFLYACGPAPEDKTLTEAGKVHDEAIAISKDVSTALEAFDDLPDSVREMQGSQIDALKQEFADWKELLVEVPGHEHDHHDHDHDHDHDHGPNELEGLPSEHILEIQQELKNQIEALRTKVQQLSK
ncbi:MAG: hypothetical protein AAGC88_08145 [Bacteroidota bacterium]